MTPGQAETTVFLWDSQAEYAHFGQFR